MTNKVCLFHENTFDKICFNVLFLILVHFDYDELKKNMFVQDVMQVVNQGRANCAENLRPLYLKFLTEKSGKVKREYKPSTRSESRSLLKKPEIIITRTPSLASLATALPSTSGGRPKTAPTSSSKTIKKDVLARATAEAMVAEQVAILDKKLRQKEKVRNLYVLFGSKICAKLLGLKNKGINPQEIHRQLMILVEPILEQLYIVVLGDDFGNFDKESATSSELSVISEPIEKLVLELVTDLKNKTIGTSDCMKIAKNKLWLNESKTALSQSAFALKKVSQNIK